MKALFQLVLLFASFMYIKTNEEESSLVLTGNQAIDSIQCDGNHGEVVEMTKDQQGYVGRFQCRIIYYMSRKTFEQYRFVVKPYCKNEKMVCLRCFRVDLKRAGINQEDIFVSVFASL